MACQVKSVTSLAVDAAAVAFLNGRMDAQSFAGGLWPFLMSGALPTSRWKKALKAVAELGACPFAKDVIVCVLQFSADKTPRGVGGLLELCYELHIAENAELRSASAAKCLSGISAGGKAAKFKKKLLALAADDLAEGEPLRETKVELKPKRGV